MNDNDKKIFEKIKENRRIGKIRSYGTELTERPFRQKTKPKLMIEKKHIVRMPMFIGLFYSNGILNQEKGRLNG
jgi:hypothetical protein